MNYSFAVLTETLTYGPSDPTKGTGNIGRQPSATSQVAVKKWKNEVEFVHAYDHSCIPIALTAMIFNSNPDSNTKPRKIVYTDVRAKKEAKVMYDQAAKKGLAAAKMTEMVGGFGQDLLKISVSNTNES